MAAQPNNRPVGDNSPHVAFVVNTTKLPPVNARGDQANAVQPDLAIYFIFEERKRSSENFGIPGANFLGEITPTDNFNYEVEAIRRFVRAWESDAPVS